MEDTLVFVDDGFFGLVKRYIQKKSGKNKKYLQTFRNICKKENLNLKHLFIYTCPPYQSPNPTLDEGFLMSKSQNMVKMLKRKRWISVREGRCQRLKKDGEYKYQQKGVDILLAIDLMNFQDNFPEIKKIILIACDSDFVPLIKQLKDKNIEIILYTYFERERGSRFSRYNQLLKSASRWVKLNESYFEDL